MACCCCCFLALRLSRATKDAIHASPKEDASRTTLLLLLLLPFVFDLCVPFFFGFAAAVAFVAVVVAATVVVVVVQGDNMLACSFLFPVFLALAQALALQIVFDSCFV